MDPLISTCGCCGPKAPVPTRCRPDAVTINILTDENDSPLTDNLGQQILLSVDRASQVYEFEFNREQTT